MTQALAAGQAHDRLGLQACLCPAADDLLAPGFDVGGSDQPAVADRHQRCRRLAPQQADDWTRCAGLRFCVSKQVTEMLAKACDAAPTLSQLVRDAHAEINEISRNALSEGLAGRHQRAVEALLKAVERTRNAKLLELAEAALERHRAHIAEAEALAERCGLLQRLCSTVGRSHLLAQDTGRPPGGLDLPQARGRPGRRAVAAQAGARTLTHQRFAWRSNALAQGRPALARRTA